MLFSACSLGVGAAMSVVSFVSEKREYRELIEKRRRLYLQYIERKEEEIQRLRAMELEDETAHTGIHRREYRGSGDVFQEALREERQGPRIFSTFIWGREM